MPRKRSRLQTMHIILELARHGMLKTHIMYRANLSHQQLEKYLDLLLNRQLLRQERNAYRTTARGREFVETFHEIQAILGEKSLAHVPG